MENITRRQFLKRVYAAIAATGASSFITFEQLLAADAAPADERLNIVWLHGSSCSGCSCSFLNIEYVPVIDILTKFTNIIFHPDLSLATGKQVEDLLNDVASSGIPYVLIVEGSTPVGMPHACLMADEPFAAWFKRLAEPAIACIGAGTCASFAGVTDMRGMEAVGALSVADFLAREGISKPIVNLPGCPMKPEHLVYTVLHYAMRGTLPELDPEHRPMHFFSHTVHERCIYYADFQENHFAEFIGDSGCLLKLGCQGVVTRNDCLINGHNNNTNSCIRAGHPCIGCASEHFPRQIMFHSYGDTRAVQIQQRERGRGKGRG